MDLAERYQLAESVLPHMLDWWIQRARPQVHWRSPDEVVAVSALPDGWQVVAVRPAERASQLLLDSKTSLARIAEVLAPGPVKMGLPRPRLDAGAAHWWVSGSCWEISYSDGAVSACGEPLDGVLSPDRTRKALVRDHNISLYEFATGAYRPITIDGTAQRPYGLHPSTGRGAALHRFLGREPDAVVVWAPDSRWLASHRLDETGVATRTWTESRPSGGGRPVAHTSAYAVVGDDIVPRADIVLLDVDAAAQWVPGPEGIAAQYHAPEADGYGFWGPQGQFQLVVTSRDWHTVQLIRTSTNGGSTTVHRESYDGWAELGVHPTQPPVVAALGAEELLWYSPGVGEGGLLVLDATTGEVTARVGTDRWLPERILHVDSASRSVLMVVSDWEHQPYRGRLAWFDLDGGEPRLFPDDGLHHDPIGCSPDGNYLVDVASGPSSPAQISVLELAVPTAAGAVLLDSDVDAPEQLSSLPPSERLTVMAADGHTPLYATLYRPAGFDPDASYPLIDHLYPGPQIGRAFPGNWATRPGTELAWAALGAVVLTLDGRGTPGRGHRFHQLQYQQTQRAGFLEDHVAAIEELGRRYPFIDTTRVAAVGHSGGAFAAFRAQARYPGTFTAAVCASGDHDQRFYMSQWLEHWHGADSATYEGIANTELAASIDGDVFLIHGEADDNVYPDLTMRLVDAMVEANKDFDLLIVPGADHGYCGRLGYVTRRAWDFTVRALEMGEPPREFRVGEPAVHFYDPVRW